MYGCNKLYCEHLGRYYAQHYKQLAAETARRQGRLPLPPLPGAHLGGHGAVRRHLRLRPRDDPRRRAGQALRLLRRAPTPGSRSWRCPTASTALLQLAAAPRGEPDPHRLQRRRVQPLGRRDPRRSCCEAFPGAEITYQVDEKRQGIVDSWPADVDDSAARRDWGFAPQYDLDARLLRVPDPDHPPALPASVTPTAGPRSSPSLRPASGEPGTRSQILAGVLADRAVGGEVTHRRDVADRHRGPRPRSVNSAPARAWASR